MPVPAAGSTRLLSRPQEKPEEPAMGYYMYKAIPPRATFGADITEAEAAIMGQHVAYWTELLGKGVAMVSWVPQN
jgi:hypothetical protein